MKKFLFVLFVLFALTACGYWQAPVQTSEVGLRMGDGTSIDEVAGPGRYTDFGWYARIVRVDVSSQTVVWSDPDLVTKDKQPIGLELAVTYRLESDDESIRDSWGRYNSAVVSPEALQALVLSRIPRVAKEITTKYSLDEMLGVNEGTGAGRALVTQDLDRLLEQELAEINVELLDVGINNISPSTTYLQLIEQKANAQVEVEVATARVAQLEEQLKAETAQTNIALEQARRDNLVAQEQAKAYDLSPRAFELKRLELMAQIFSQEDKVIFIPEGADISLILPSSENIVPLPAEGGTD